MTKTEKIGVRTEQYNERKKITEFENDTFSGFLSRREKMKINEIKKNKNKRIAK